jgi:outer membrane receptor protein involved in Fe transport
VKWLSHFSRSMASQRRGLSVTSFMLDTTGWRDRLTASVTGIFVGERQDVDALTTPPRRVSLPGYARFDAAVSYVLLKDVTHLCALTLFGNARNLTDERYEGFFGFSSPRATFLVGSARASESV